MTTLLQVVTTDALVASDVWRKMVQTAVNRSFNQITVCYILAYVLSNLTGLAAQTGDRQPGQSTGQVHH